MKRSILITYTLFALLGALLLVWLIPTYSPEFAGYGIPSTTLPYALAACMLFFSCIAIVRELRQPDDSPPPAPAHGPFLIGLAVILLPAMRLFHAVGLIAGGAVVLGVLLFMAGQRNPVWLLGTAIGFPLALWGLMRHVFLVPLP